MGIQAYYVVVSNHIYVPRNLGICAISRLRCAFLESRNCVPISRLHKDTAQSRDCAVLFGIYLYVSRSQAYHSHTFCLGHLLAIRCLRNSNTHYTAILMLKGATDNGTILPFQNEAKGLGTIARKTKAAWAARNACILPSSAREQEAAYQSESHATCSH